MISKKSEQRIAENFENIAKRKRELKALTGGPQTTLMMRIPEPYAEAFLMEVKERGMDTLLPDTIIKKALIVELFKPLLEKHQRS